MCLDYYFDNTCSTYCNNADDSCVNGLCNQNGICDCNQSTENGFWGGTTCNVCINNYYPASGDNACTVNCIDGGAMCLHGTCASDGSCVCHTDDVNGYWSGSRCNQCAINYYGDDCKTLCNDTDGDSNQNCFHGSCNNNGICECDKIL